MRIAVIGFGSWGTTITKILTLKGFPVYVCEKDKKVRESFEKYKENRIYLKGIKFSKEEKVFLSDNLKETVSGADYIFYIIPNRFLRETLIKLKPLSAPETVFVNFSKGIEAKTLKCGCEINQEVSAFKKYGAVSGPTHAEEVSKRIPTSAVAAFKCLKIAVKTQKLLSCGYFRVYTHSDVVGTESAGAFKNIIAIASGISDGLSFGDNTKAFIISRALKEMILFGRLKKASSKTFFGLAGIGDLTATCYSKHSRNRNFGELLGRGVSVRQAIKKIAMVVEGYYTVKAVYEKLGSLRGNFPITSEVYKILYKNKKARKSVESLMNRKLKKEKI